MNRNFRKDLQSIFEPPKPQRKKEFLQQINYPKLNKYSFLLTQASYISKKLWLMNGLLFATIIWLTYYFSISFSTVWFTSSLLPFIALISITEISKSISYNMTELEMSCKFCFSQVIMYRMTIIGSFNFLVLLTILLIYSVQNPQNLLFLVLCVFTPFLLTCYGSIFALNRLNFREIKYVTGGIACAISLVYSSSYSWVQFMLNNSFLWWWLVLFIILIVLIGVEVVRFIQKTEELQWNLI